MSDPLARLGDLRRFLRHVAMDGGVVTYHEAARAIGLEPPHVIHSISVLLEAMMDEDAAHGHPFLAALVVSRAREDLPALGFFQKAGRLGRFAGDPFGAEALGWHAAERALATAFHAHP